ncbi:MAG TPA: hypothetical protein VNH46_08625 [Gemmatimonadales bacterium]|nr:hypothetical protein [Gemmatimonadales bacterium]
MAGEPSGTQRVLAVKIAADGNVTPERAAQIAAEKVRSQHLAWIVLALGGAITALATLFALHDKGSIVWPMVSAIVTAGAFMRLYDEEVTKGLVDFWLDEAKKAKAIKDGTAASDPPAPGPGSE